MTIPSGLHVARRLVRLLYLLRGTGLPRLAEAVRRWAARRWPDRTEIIDDFQGGLRFRCALGDDIGSLIYWKGAHSGGELAVLRRVLKPGMCFVDAGAHQGEFTLPAAAWVGPRGSVLSFEPVSALRLELLRNIEINGFTNVTVFPWALADREGRAPLYGPGVSLRLHGTVNTGLATLFPQADRHERIEVVRIRRIDDVLEEAGTTRVDVMKLDVEGAEQAVLRGAAKLLARESPVLLVEVNAAACAASGSSAEDLCRELRDRGYRLERIEEDGTTIPLRLEEPARSFQNVLAWRAR